MTKQIKLFLTGLKEESFQCSEFMFQIWTMILKSEEKFKTNGNLTDYL